MKLPQKINTTTTIGTSSPAPGIESKGNETICQRDICTFTLIPVLFPIAEK